MAGPNAGNHALVDANATWELRQEGSNLKWYVWWGPGYCVNNAVVTGCITDTTTWHHVTATVDASGNMALTVDNTTASGTGYYPAPMVTQNAGIYVGEWFGTDYFNGSLDDIKISQYRIP